MTLTDLPDESAFTSRVNEFNADGEARIYRSLRHFWHPIAYAEDLGDTPIRATLMGQQLVVVRLDGEVCVFDDLCAHRGSALSIGTVIGGRELQCPYHGWQYDGSGRCTLAPQRPDLAGHLRASVHKYLSAERYGLIWACLVDEPYYPLPEYPQFDDPGLHHIACRPLTDWDCSAPRRVENYTDYSHFAILHDGYLGDASQPAVPGHDVWRDENRLENLQDKKTLVRVPVDSAAWGGKDLPEDPYVYFSIDWRVFMPLTCMLNIVFSDGNKYNLLFHPTPLGPRSIRNFTIAGRDFGDPAKADEELGGFVHFIYEQDRPVVESQRPEELPEDLSEEMHLKGVDKYSIEYRRWLFELAEKLGGS
ncbi:(2Fe-2S)-binding protein [Pseudonocardia sulfidoxydans NBRC 16205]|uniref:(2Fe-2S)-binding protein n=1 Tax=Pseudonocardia sulfidoxydans NBRC 16205 TaxID=1223511 RepID=A0A511DIS7_9PSEU|nr:aromatic ring-hydroxylating dioxygenase subunit alpha [Pseudonocardia sulfidoxydans]GEL23664.1 (2Fe-2S)-binding protein [Pseudonocardia sulfidoxydans NBRC 16205]